MIRHKNIRRNMSLLACVCLLCGLPLACSGCGASSKPADDWETSIDITEIFNEELESALKDNKELFDYLEIDDFSIDVTVSVQEDGTYQLTVDERALGRTIEDLLDTLKTGTEKYQEKNGQGASVGNPITSSESRLLIGNWETTIDMTDMINDEMRASLGSDADLMDYFSISGFSMTISMSFQENGTYRLSVDEAELEKTIDRVIETFRAGMVNYLADLIAQEGLDMTVDELLSEMGMTLDTFIEEVFDKDDLMSSMNDLESSGTFEAEGGILYLTDKDGTGPEVYELSGNVLTFTGEGVQDGNLVGLYPLVFYKK